MNELNSTSSRTAPKSTTVFFFPSEKGDKTPDSKSIDAHSNIPLSIFTSNKSRKCGWNIQYHQSIQWNLTAHLSTMTQQDISQMTVLFVTVLRGAEDAPVIVFVPS